MDHGALVVVLPDDASRLLRVSVHEVQAYRDWLANQTAAPKGASSN